MYGDEPIGVIEHIDLIRNAYMNKLVTSSLGRPFWLLFPHGIDIFWQTLFNDKNNINTYRQFRMDCPSAFLGVPE